MRKTVSSILAAMLLIQLSGCGYILHPERRGQTGGRIDAGIAILDGVGLLLFVVPGVIAFIVDFSTGAIYYPGGLRGALDPQDMKQCLFDTEHLSRARLEEIIRTHTGLDVQLDDAHVRVTRLESLTGLPRRLASLQPALGVNLGG